MAPIRVLIVDDQRVFIEAISSTLDAEPGISVIGSAGTSAQAVSTIDLRDPDVVIVDFDLAHEDPTDLVAELHRRYSDLPIVVITDDMADQRTHAAVLAGARAFLPKSASVTDLVHVMRSARCGETRLPSSLLDAVLEGLGDGAARTRIQPPLDLLTPRELEVLHELVSGHDRQLIARKFGLSINTVRTHIKHVLAKLGVHSALEAVAVALRAGMRPLNGEPATATNGGPASRADRGR